jgi:hypothetical protein
MGLMANPVSPMFISELWFADNGHLMLEICPHYAEYVDPADIWFSNGSSQTQLPPDFAFPDNGQVVVADLSLLMPTLVFDPATDTLMIGVYEDNGYFYAFDSITWGESYSNSINPLFAGQSWARHMYQSIDGSGYSWCKNAVPTPGLYPYQAQSQANMHLRFANQNNNPIANVVCWGSGAHAISDPSGVAADTIRTGKLSLYYVIPGSATLHALPPVWIEPDQNYQQTIVVPMTSDEDNLLPAAEKARIRLYPSPYRWGQDELLVIQYSDSNKLTEPSNLKIYDAKGRFIEDIVFPKSGTLAWKPGSDLAAGVYLFRLCCGNRIIDSATLTILK